MWSQIARLNKCEITLVAFVWPFPTVCFQMSPQIAWIYNGCIWFFSTVCIQMCPHYCENILTFKGRGRRSSRTIKSPFTLYTYIPKNPGISFSEIPGFWSTENPGIPGSPLGPRVRSREWQRVECIYHMILKCIFHLKRGKLCYVTIMHPPFHKYKKTNLWPWINGIGSELAEPTWL